MSSKYKNYHPLWESFISPYRRYIVAKNHCEKCGAENHKPHPVTGKKVILTVAHLNHDISDNRPENLMALCQRCHLNHDKYDNANRRRYGKKYNKNPKLF